MLRRRASAAVIFLLLVSTGAPIDAATDAEIFSKIRARMAAFLASYKGVRSRQRVEIKEYKYTSGAYQRRKTIDRVQTGSFYQPPTVQILSCKIDGKSVAAGECRPKHKRKPSYPVFDKDSARHYRLSIAGKVKVNNKLCYRVEVRAKKQTKRHFVGQMYFTVEGLRLVKLVGSIADYPFGLKKLLLKFYFKELGKHDVVSWGYVDLGVRVPLLVNLRAVTTFFARDHRLIRR